MCEVEWPDVFVMHLSCGGVHENDLLMIIRYLQRFKLLKRRTDIDSALLQNEAQRSCCFFTLIFQTGSSGATFAFLRGTWNIWRII